MRILSESNHNADEANATAQGGSLEDEGGLTPGRKFNISVEKKIEKLWLDARGLGWDFRTFVVFILEILTIMHYRRSLDQGAQSQSAARRKRQAA
jgi:hypothetical protein